LKLTFKYKLENITNSKKEILDELMWHTTKVYNMVLYQIKEEKVVIDEKVNLNIASSPIYKKERKDNWHSKYLHSQTLQEVIINVIENYKSYKALEKIYKEEPQKLKGKPRFPKFKSKTIQPILFTKYAIRKINQKIMLSLSKEMQNKFKVKSLDLIIPIKLNKLVNLEDIKQIRITKKNMKYTLEIIYEKGEKSLDNTYSNIMAIDLGLNNIVACTNKDNNYSMLVNGKDLKSKNRYYNNKIQKLMKIQMCMLKNSKKYKGTKRIRRLYEKRKNYIETYMHKVSKKVIEYAIQNKCNTIVIGALKGIKYKMNYNKNFVEIPFQKLLQKIQYKAELRGIKLEKISEKYTSGISSIDNEPIKRQYYNKKRRVSRGIFITNQGKLINADINGSLNILRKYLNSKTKLEIAMNKGREHSPIKIRVA